LRAPADGTAKVPAAVIIGGTVGVDRDGNAPGLAIDAYSWLADQLSAHGWASIRYDKLGTGATGLGPFESDPSTILPLGYDQLRVQPARAALAFLAAQPGIDTSRIVLIGHSEGGGVALTVAHDHRYGCSYGAVSVWSMPLAEAEVMLPSTVLVAVAVFPLLPSDSKPEPAEANLELDPEHAPLARQPHAAARVLQKGPTPTAASALLPRSPHGFDTSEQTVDKPFRRIGSWRTLSRRLSQAGPDWGSTGETV
jgi:dienelactone hydrolase